MIKLKVIQLLFNEIKDEGRLYKYYIKNIVWEMLRDNCDISKVNCSDSPLKYTSVAKDKVDEYYKETALNSL